MANKQHWDGYPHKKMPPDCPVKVLGKSAKGLELVDSGGEKRLVKSLSNNIVADLFAAAPDFPEWAWPRFDKEGRVTGLVFSDLSKCFYAEAARQNKKGEENTGAPENKTAKPVDPTTPATAENPDHAEPKANNGVGAERSHGGDDRPTGAAGADKAGEDHGTDATVIARGEAAQANDSKKVSAREGEALSQANGIKSAPDRALIEIDAVSYAASVGHAAAGRIYRLMSESDDDWFIGGENVEERDVTESVMALATYLESRKGPVHAETLYRFAKGYGLHGHDIDGFDDCAPGFILAWQTFCEVTGLLLARIGDEQQKARARLQAKNPQDPTPKKRRESVFEGHGSMLEKN